MATFKIKIDSQNINDWDKNMNPIYVYYNDALNPIGICMMEKNERGDIIGIVDIKDPQKHFNKNNTASTRFFNFLGEDNLTGILLSDIILMEASEILSSIVIEEPKP